MDLQKQKKAGDYGFILESNNENLQASSDSENQDKRKLRNFQNLQIPSS